MKNFEDIKIDAVCLERKYKTLNGLFPKDIKELVEACKYANAMTAPQNENFKLSVGKCSKLKSSLIILFIILSLSGIAATLVHFGVVDFSLFRDATTDFTQQLSLFQTTILPFLLTFLGLAFVGLLTAYPSLQLSAARMDDTLTRMHKYHDKKHVTQTICSKQNSLNMECTHLLKDIEILKKQSTPEINKELDQIYTNLTKTSQTYGFFSMMILSKINNE